MGSISAERITLNEKTLWKGGPNTAKGAEYYWNVNKQSSGVLKEIRQAFLDGDSKKAGYLTQENFNGLGAYEEKDETPFRFGALCGNRTQRNQYEQLPPHPVVGFGDGCGAILQRRDTVST